MSQLGTGSIAARLRPMSTPTPVATNVDQQLHEKVLHELQWDPEIPPPVVDQIAIAVKDGVVTLSGVVPSYWIKDEAEQAVKRVHGVRAVANDLEVKPDLASTDAEIAHNAVRALESHLFIPSDRIKVTVKNGWVTLEGDVRWQFQKRLAESAIKKLKGVTGITNNIEVRPKVSPSQVQEAVVKALLRSAEVDARRISVDVEGTTVKLYGSVRSWAEKQEAEHAAWSAPGITAVENHIEVEP
ncbi:MAG: Transport-associated protein [Bryobacterales bacterium]|nr:Transport-associated protein [Bryobacterales bacterium]